MTWVVPLSALRTAQVALLSAILDFTGSFSFMRKLALAFAILLVACAGPGVKEVLQHHDQPRRQELAATPFFPHDAYQGGPAALATLLTASGYPATPEELAPQVYVPAHKRSGQTEMLAAARHRGALTLMIPARLDALLAEVAAGNPVLVLQNRGFSWAPAWHYAVVVGYDLDSKDVWLRSGTTRREEMSLNTFARSWERSGNWAFLTLPPGKLPASVDQDMFTRALLEYEQSAPIEDVRRTYAAAAEHWRDDLVLAIGAGNSAYIAHDFMAARAAFQQAVDAHPDSAPAHNNLANVELALGHYAEAQQHAERALQLAAPDSSLRPLILDTLAAIQERRPH
jgi:tetratricopeptide (TPR) repeat protein